MILTKDNATKENRKIFFQGVKEEQERRKKNIKPVEPRPEVMNKYEKKKNTT